QVATLNNELSTAQSALNTLGDSNDDKKQNTGIKELGDRLTLLEVSKEDTDVAPAAPAGDLSEIQAQLAVHDKDIAQLKNDLKGSSQISSIADSFLGGGSRDANGERESGLNRLSELRTLFSGDAGELTEEQQQRRDELTKQFRGQRDDWTIRGFDRSLELKLDDGQKDTLKQFLAQERASLDELKGQELEKEALTASQKQIKVNTDARVETILTADQNTSWGKYRSQSRSSRSFGRSSRSRGSREGGSDRGSE
ncbi:MAG: hypothetical protein VCD16_04490, partial [Planctomycetota bacterium]